MEYILIFSILTLLNCEWNGIDVSEFQGPDIDFDKVKAEGINFVILRAGFGTSIDKYFESNYKKAKAAGMNVGVYWYAEALTENDIKNEAQLCLNAISDKKLEYPIFYNIEQKDILVNGKTFSSNIAINFCSIMEVNKKFCGIFSSKKYLDAYFNDKVKTYYSIWVAQHNSKCSYRQTYWMWQKSSKGKVNGINGNVCLDVSYLNFPTIIKRAHLNGY